MGIESHVGDDAAQPAHTEQPIPFSVPDIDDADVASVVKVLRSGWLTTGAECAGLEGELAEYLGVRHAVALSSCTAALETALAYLRLRTGARVAVPTWTFASTALAAVRRGATPMLLDVDADTLNLCPRALAASLEQGLDAVIAVHFGGVPVGKEIHELCRSAGVPLVEDAAHAMGASDHRGRVGGQGTVGACFSFYATKNVTSGEGGALCTDDPELAKFSRSYRLHGLSDEAWGRYRVGASPDYDLHVPGIKANLPDVLSALARSQLSRLDQMQARRRGAVLQYRALLSGRAGLAFLPNELWSDGADHLMVVVLPEHASRDVVIASLAARGIGTSVHFKPLHNFSWFREHAEIGRTGVQVADGLAPRTMSLPLHPGLTNSDVERVCEELLTVLGG